MCRPIRNDSAKCDLMVSFDDIDFFRHLIRSRPERRIAEGAITYDKPTRHINSHRMQRRRVSVHADVLETKEVRADPVGRCAIYGQPERIDCTGADQIRITKGVRLSKVVPTTGGCRQQIAGQRVGHRHRKRRQDIAAENRMLGIDLIVHLVNRLPLIGLLGGPPIDCSAGICCRGKHGRHLQRRLIK